MLDTDKNDPIKNRRLLAFITAVHAFFLWPYVIAYLNKHYGISDELCTSMLHYIEILSTGPMAAYFLAAHKEQGGLMSMREWGLFSGMGMMGGGDIYSETKIPGAEGSFAVPGTNLIQGGD